MTTSFKDYLDTHKIYSHRHRSMLSITDHLADLDEQIKSSGIYYKKNGPDNYHVYDKKGEYLEGDWRNNYHPRRDGTLIRPHATYREFLSLQHECIDKSADLEQTKLQILQDAAKTYHTLFGIEVTQAEKVELGFADAALGRQR